MKSAAQKAFIRAARRAEAMYADDVFLLRPRQYLHRVAQLDGACCMTFDIVARESCQIAGEIALRFGEGESLYYLGHIGYHIDPPFRGRHGALRACRLCIPLFRSMGMHSLVITTDIDNLPSIRTCEKLGCVLESTVEVPGWCRSEFSLSQQKRRYVCEI